MGYSDRSGKPPRPARPSLKKGYHCAYDIHYHFVFVVKYRRALLSPQIVSELRRLTLEIEERYLIEVECLGADRDHIHLLCSAHPKMAPGDIVRTYKSITAIQLFKTFPDLKKSLWGGEFWSDGYYVATAARKGDWNSLLRYVENQGQTPEEIELTLLLPEPSTDSDFELS